MTLNLIAKVVISDWLYNYITIESQGRRILNKLNGC